MVFLLFCYCALKNIINNGKKTWNYNNNKCHGYRIAEKFNNDAKNIKYFKVHILSIIIMSLYSLFLLSSNPIAYWQTYTDKAQLTSEQ